jgi:prepilin signal peptidase PulO-like enzyme (type II secretory pathway)
MIKKNSFPDIMTIMGFAVAALFLAFGLYILFSRQMANVPKEFRTIFGVIVISYGLFRSVIIYQKSKQRRNSDEETDF